MNQVTVTAYTIELLPLGHTYTVRESYFCHNRQIPLIMIQGHSLYAIEKRSKTQRLQKRD